jgi:hypothetical protein
MTQYIKIPVPDSLDPDSAKTLVMKNLLSSMHNAEEMMSQDDIDYSKIFISNRLTEMSFMLENLEIVEEDN